jgi:hypothetical protein
MKDNCETISSYIKTIKRVHPELRFGQILSNVCVGKDIFYIEDEKLVESLKNFIHNLK